jgi:hypothetical protein
MDIKEIDPALSSGAGGVVEKDFALSEYAKDAWRPSSRSRSKTLRLFTRFVGSESTHRSEKILDVYVCVEPGFEPAKAVDNDVCTY